ncbi:ETC complex I subunit [Beijerinckiaceae bacterium RH AL1]|jgi:ETC complex I subunit conserved region|nr:ETC complex I subunit [Beijerinckiaceae bacterium]VVB45664.1 ETC complex I subunit [Beijerinckiaceae bacterium RH CH11]VVB45739.1 ETC complex I subunit [Beijerinckiaceae bacterium RH AL8]VVC54978.1 ETC complex I subunit [Beijerinckiaceae bacterium RH AL1]
MSARIYKPSPSATQSGKGATKLWVLVYEPASAPQVEPLMGWTSSSDMNRQITLRFATRDEAVAYAERNGIAYRVEEEKPIERKVLAYSDNFKSTRRGMWTH